MIKVNDISELMQQCVALGYTFMFSQSGLPNNYNIHVAYMPKVCDNRSLCLSFRSDRQTIYRSASLNSKYVEFSDISDVMRYITKEIAEVT